MSAQYSDVSLDITTDKGISPAVYGLLNAYLS